MGDIVLRGEVLSILKEMAEPFDLDALVSKGVLKHSGGWYTILKANEFPSHVMRHTSSLQQTVKGEVRFKFRKDWEKAKRLYERISGNSLSE